MIGYRYKVNGKKDESEREKKRREKDGERKMQVKRENYICIIEHLSLT